MPDKVSAQIGEIGRNTEKHAGHRVRAMVMEGGEMIKSSSGDRKVAEWTKSAVARLNKLTSSRVRREIMLDCGYNCIRANPRPLRSAQARRAKFASEEAFLSAEVKRPPKGMRFDRDGDLLIQSYTPLSYGSGMRCYCSLMRGLPRDQIVSLTYCQCSRGFVEKYWEGILGRPVKVDLVESAISGADECKFVIHL